MPPRHGSGPRLRTSHPVGPARGLPVHSRHRRGRNVGRDPGERGRRLLAGRSLDGTRGFASGGKDFTVNIGLVRHDRPVLGVVALPGYGLIYSGGQGLGAHRSDGTNSTPIHTATPPAEGLRVLASSHHGNPELLERWLAGRQVASVEKLSSSVKFMRVAEGAADFYPRFGPTMEWDTAAPQAILEAAGGALLDETGAPCAMASRTG